MDDLMEHAAAMGLRVRFEDLGARHGEVHASGLVVINDRRPVAVQRITLAHECGHWHHGHDWRIRHDRARDEHQADLYAARLLIDVHAYVEAEEVVGCDSGALAVELGVTAAMIERWREAYLARVGVVRRIPTRASVRPA